VGGTGTLVFWSEPSGSPAAHPPAAPPGTTRKPSSSIWDRDGGRKPVRGRIANAKTFGWLIYAAGFAIWLFGYLSAGHAPVFDWNAATPWWISSFVPNLEAELGLALMFASMIPTLPWARLFPFAALLVFAGVTLAWWGVFGVANLACDLGIASSVR
jgi:hypothetical protein